MFSRIALVACGTVFVVTGAFAPADAQRTGTRMGGVEARARADVQTPDTIRQLVADYAACVIKNRRRNVEDYLATPPDAVGNDRIFYKIRDEDCLQAGVLELPEWDFRGAAYGELYRLDFGRQGPVSFAATPSIDFIQGEDVQAPRVRTNVALREFADCVVRSAPSESRALVLSRIASQQEKAALARLVPHLGPCIYEGQSISVSAGPLRLIISEVLYRLSKAAA